MLASEPPPLPVMPNLSFPSKVGNAAPPIADAALPPRVMPAHRPKPTWAAPRQGPGLDNIKSVSGTGAGLTFANRRPEVWWKFCEALDPDQPDGSAIALPPDPELRADLCAPTWKLTQRAPAKMS